jgi:hypothetical protein
VCRRPRWIADALQKERTPGIVNAPAESVGLFRRRAKEERRCVMLRFLGLGLLSVALLGAVPSTSQAQWGYYGYQPYYGYRSYQPYAYRSYQPYGSYYRPYSYSYPYYQPYYGYRYYSPNYYTPYNAYRPYGYYWRY